jgi:hypothetical protein
MLKLEDKHIKQIDNYISYLSMTFDEEEVNETVAQIFLTLMYERPLLKNSLSNKAERFLYESGIYKEVTMKRNKAERNKKYQDKLKGDK